MSDTREPEEKSTLRGSNASTPDYNALFGKEEKREKFAQKTPFGEVRNVKRFTWLEWVFLVIATISILGVLAVTIERMVFFNKSFVNVSVASNGENGTKWKGRDHCNEWTCTNDFIFSVALLLNLIFCAFYCYDGLFRERQYEMIGYATGVVVIIIYIISNYILKGREHQDIRLIRLVVVSVLGPVNVVLALIIWWRMGYLAFNTVGSSRELNRAFKLRSLFLTMQDFNLQVVASISILIWAKSGDFSSLPEKVVVPILLVYVPVTMILGWIAVMYELKAVSVVWYFTSLPFLGYYCFKLANVARTWMEFRKKFTIFYGLNRFHHHDTTAFSQVGAALIIAAILGMVVYLIMVALMLALQYTCFGLGLKEKITPPFNKFSQKILAKRKGTTLLE